jgi:hypothetical protein
LPAAVFDIRIIRDSEASSATINATKSEIPQNDLAATSAGFRDRYGKLGRVVHLRSSPSPTISESTSWLRSRVKRFSDAKLAGRLRVACRFVLARLTGSAAISSFRDGPTEEIVDAALKRQAFRRLVPAPYPKIIWIYWDRGWQQAPALCRLCRDTWKTLNPGYRVVELDDTILGEHLVPLEWERNPVITIGGFTNILRMRLLTRYGGIWTDATVYPQRPLDQWLPSLMQSGFFAFSHPGPDRMISTWFMAAATPCPLVQTWRDILEIYWRRTSTYDVHFVCHYLFEVAYWLYPALRRQWQDTPKVSADGPHAVGRRMRDPRALDELAPLIRSQSVPVHKLNWKITLPRSLAGTPLGTLCGRETLA